ncbi:RNA polymerase II C-terminal domain phosphatase-like 4 [Melia azedarach]|uniref:RNA polymerase II C-terminal domain phosphatase-like 4 n=1 Tax=Melia azedarach TaxID=155640 RepID=A0ACC1XMM9_MELAZ|nr:RNA polymerase II C-terminal domain phosphatase-like 4 [Melia azedarach]
MDFLRATSGSGSRSPSPPTQALCKSCSHPKIYNELCVYCTQRIEEGYGVAFDYMLKGLRFSEEEVTRLKAINSDAVFRQKKLHLVLDLDHTLLHAVNFENLASEDEHLMTRVSSFKDLSDGDLLKISAGYLVKLRPYLRTFLKDASTMYDIYICTMGTRHYAELIAELLDPKCEYYISGRLITREDFKQKGKKNLELVLGQEREQIGMKRKRKSYSERETDESEINGALANVLRILRRVHWLFFDNPANLASGDVRSFLGNIRRQILAGCTLLLSDAEKFPLLEWRAEELGAACTTIHDSSVTHVVSACRGAKDCRWAEQHKKIFLVHPRWIYAAYYLWKRQPENDYFPL